MKTLLCRNVSSDDGVILKTDIYLPNGPGPFPAILTRTPYDRIGHYHDGVRFTGRGYAYVAQDVRGKFGSDGEFHPLEDEARDGQATIDWIANQNWCNGRIGLWGASYLGIVQVPAAAGGHEALKCIAPSVAPANFFRDWVRYDGCLAFGNVIKWLVSSNSDRSKIPFEHFDWDQAWRSPTIDVLEERVGVELPTLRKWIGHDTDDEYWQKLDQCRMHEKVCVHGLHIGGWFDHITRGQFDAFRNIRDCGATAIARTGQRLLIGPWGHTTFSATGEQHWKYGDWDFTPEADISISAREMQFFDYHMKEIDNGYSSLPAVTLFLMGENRWVCFKDWPPSAGTVQAWHLSSNGSANMRSGDGVLSLEQPTHDAEDTYRYDPADPVPMRGGAIYWGFDSVCGPVDQRPILDRPDILYYRSPKLGKPLIVIGEVWLDLVVQSTAEDTDFIAKLCVEEPSGSITVLSNGSLRCRYRESWSNPKPLTAGKTVSIQLHLGNTAYTFPAGSRLGLMITSSEFPRILPHHNTMAPAWGEKNPVIARNSVLHGPGTLSRLELPVIED